MDSAVDDPLRKMHHFVMNRALRASAGAVVLLALGVVALEESPAAQGAVTGGPDVLALGTTMRVVGYDLDVARSNGFEIEVQADGTPIAIAVTEEARAIEQNYDRSAFAGTGIADTRSGDCGTSSLYISRAVGGAITITTGYSVYTTSVYHRWTVAGATPQGTWDNPFTGYNWSSSWAATHTEQFPYTPIRGFGQVTPGSYVRLINGLSCSSMQPYDTW